MSDFKGTPGPWSRSGNAVFNDDGYDIVHLTYGEYTGTKEDQANTNLIAAAPELLEALQLFTSKNEQGFVMNQSDVDKCKDAIAKALGQ